MIKSLGVYAITAATMIAPDGPGAIMVVPAVRVVAPGDTMDRPAGGVRFSARYTCTAPIVGARPITIHGTLAAAPDPATAGTPTRFHLHISRMSLSAPLTINAWSATARIDVSGAQTASFRLSGSGGVVSAKRPVSGELFGAWTPSVPGTVRLRGGDVTIRGNVPMLGEVTAPCTPRGRRHAIMALAVGSARPVRSVRDVTARTRIAGTAGRDTHRT